MNFSAARPRILITGATGLLGRPTLRAFAANPDWHVAGAAFRRAAPGLERLDLSQTAALPAALDRLAPDIIIHAAAERRPDISERDPAALRRLNVDSTAAIAQWTAARRAFMVYISTDYVFDGSRPPYHPTDPARPLNAYGQSKLDGELAVRASGCDSLILRVPILYGAVETLDESPVTLLAQAMLAAPPAEPLPMEHWAARYPTHAADVAQVLRQMIERRLSHPDFNGVFHWSGDEKMTKHTMAQTIAPLLNFDPSRLIPDPSPPKGAPRPQDSHLDTSALEHIGIGQRTPFASALPAILAPHL